MLEVYLIRHGQASFNEDDYDKLSKKGVAQAKILGEHWQQLNRHFSSNTSTKYYAGSLLRHEQTAEHFFDGLFANASNDKSRLKNSALTIHSGFNELDHEDILQCYSTNWRSFQSVVKEAPSTMPEKGEQKVIASQFFKIEFSV